ncbi:hypothetical protein JCM5350_004411 [Sporobolomyces pararoseus]
MSQLIGLHVCSVCENQTTKVCSNCKEMYFCSQRCQKLIWPTHKFLCGKLDRLTFSFPPLSKEERADVDLLNRSRRRFDHTCDKCVSPPQTKVEGASLFEHVQSLGLFEGDWSSFLDAITVGDNLIEEPRLSIILTLVRAHLDESGSVLRHDQVVRSKGLDQLIFDATARGFSPLISCRDAKDHLATLDSNPLMRFNKFLQQLTILCSLFVTMRERNIKLIPEIRIAGRRLLEMKDSLVQSFHFTPDPVTLDQLLHLFERWECFSTMPDLSVDAFQRRMEEIRPKNL